ncbi:EamA-like transporter family protein [Rubellimicrobium sp. CFH 75288]|nr:EamA-like transporter family protein [Rubellimicrobium sp. CFH 75288]
METGGGTERRGGGWWPRTVALLAGGCLALMVLCNAEVGRQGGVLWASLAPHLTGSAAALLLVTLLGARWRAPGVPRWAFLGGLSGAATVMLTSLAATSALALAGTLALGLAGQAAFGRAADRWGWLGLPRRNTAARDDLGLALVLAGSGLILWGAR